MTAEMMVKKRRMEKEIPEMVTERKMKRKIMGKKKMEKKIPESEAEKKMTGLTVQKKMMETAKRMIAAKRIIWKKT